MGKRMKEVVRGRRFKQFILVVLLLSLFLNACGRKSTHLSQSLESPNQTSQKSTQTSNLQNPPQELAEPSLVFTESAEGSGIARTPTATQPTQTLPGTPPAARTPTATLIVISPTATRKYATPIPATATTQAPQTRTSTPVPSFTPTATQPPTATAPTAQTGWEGEWVVYLQQDGRYITGTLTLTLNEGGVVASSDFDGAAYTFNGITFAEGMQITGSWQSDNSNGYFWWGFISEDQFGGNLDLKNAFCGSRSGGGMPTPCFIEPPR